MVHICFITYNPYVKSYYTKNATLFIFMLHNRFVLHLRVLK